MAQTQDTVLLRDAVAAAKAGNKAHARQLLRQASVHNPNNELVWLWRASLSESPKEATFYLGEVLRVNPLNQKASAWLERCKGQASEAAKAPAPPPPPSSSIPPSAPVPPPAAPASEAGLRQSILRAAENLGSTVNPADPVAVPVGARTPHPEPVRSGDPMARVETPVQPQVSGVPSSSPFSLPPLKTPFPSSGGSPIGQDGFRGGSVRGAGSIPAPVPPSPVARWVCPFCGYGSDASHRRCPTCKAITVLEELREVEKNDGVVEKSVRETIARLEAIPNDQRQFENNLHLALAHLNLREATKALPYLKQATAQRRNDWSLLGVLDQIQWRKVILVVDDSLTIRKALANFLEKNEFRVVMAEDGKKALERLNEVVPDLVLLDITMPNLDGYQVCKTMKDNALTKTVPVVMLSGKDGIFDKVRGKLAGCSDYVTKPFDPEALLKTIRKYVKA